MRIFMLSKTFFQGGASMQIAMELPQMEKFDSISVGNYLFKKIVNIFVLIL